VLSALSVCVLRRCDSGGRPRELSASDGLRSLDGHLVARVGHQAGEEEEEAAARRRPPPAAGLSTVASAASPSHAANDRRGGL
jgi:hypothetical protein